MADYRIIDGEGIGWRLFTAAQEDFEGAGSVSPWVVAYLEFVANLVSSDPGCLNLIVWEGRAQWRYDLYPNYKGNRTRTAEQAQDRARFKAELSVLKELVQHAPVATLWHPQAEGDDLARICVDAISAQGYNVEMRTVDSDWQQLLRPRVSWKEFGRARRYLDGASMEPREISRLVEVKALAGDDSDSIDGLPGVAEKRAEQILSAYGGLQQLLACARSLEGLKGAPRWAQNLMLPQMQELVERNILLVDLRQAPRLDPALLKLGFGDFDLLSFLEKAQELGASRWFNEVSKHLKGLLVNPNHSAYVRFNEFLRTSWRQ